jgi:hypothetical protein
MAKSFFPSTDATLSVWATNYRDKIGNYATELSLTPEQVAAEQSFCDHLIASVNNVSSKRNQLKSAIDGKKDTVELSGGALRAEISRHKTLANYTEAIGQDLGVVAHSVAIDFANYKAKISAELYGGLIRIKFQKKYADGINLYRRKKGTGEWLFVARATKSPFDHSLSLQVAGQPEHWEYRAFGVVDDNEVGIASDIVEVIYGI